MCYKKQGNSEETHARTNLSLSLSLTTHTYNANACMHDSHPEGPPSDDDLIRLDGWIEKHYQIKAYF